jgi:3-dehydroquinate synthase
MTMTTRIAVALDKRSYPILIGTGILEKLGAACRVRFPAHGAFVVSNPTVWALHGNRLKGSLSHAGIPVKVCLVEDTERSKSLRTAESLLEEMADFSRGKKIFAVAFGGGVVGDLAGFCASVFKRGTACVQVPTTLLAQVDSAIGGKTAVDLPQAKNLVGTFHQPVMVYSDTSLLSTLPAAQVRNGMAEVIKYACISDKSLFTLLEHEEAALRSLDPKALAGVIVRCSRIKARLVSQDEREEKGIRTILNFGHTAGHAIEAASGYKGYGHGEAVALGMRIACALSRSLTGLKEEDASRIEALLNAYGLPRALKGLALAKVLGAMSLDKKSLGAKNTWVLLKGIGRSAVVHGVKMEHIRRAVAARMA